MIMVNEGSSFYLKVMHQKAANFMKDSTLINQKSSTFYIIYSIYLSHLNAI